MDNTKTLVVKVTENVSGFQLGARTAGYNEIIAYKNKDTKTLTLYVKNPIILGCIDNLYQISCIKSVPANNAPVRLFDGAPEKLVAAIRDLHIVDFDTVLLELH